jgi:hypothetical protein
VLRTPSYPIYLGIFRELFGVQGDVAAMMVQIIVFLASIKCFWWLASHLSLNKKVVFVMTAAYGLIPGISTYALVPLTELFAMCGILFLLALLVKMSERLRIIHTIEFVLLLTFLIFLRPALLFLFVVIALLAIVWICRKKMKQGLVLIGTMAFILILLVSYKQAIQKEYGISTISSVSLCNDLGLIDEDVRSRISTSISYDEADKYSYKQDSTGMALYIKTLPLKERYVNEAKAQLGLGWYVLAYYRALDSFNYIMFKTYLCESRTLSPAQYQMTEIWRTLENRLPFKQHIFWYVLLLYTSILLMMIFKYKALNWFNWVLCLSCWGQMAVMFIGAGDDYIRLFIPTTPLIFLILVQMISAIQFRLNANTLRLTI